MHQFLNKREVVSRDGTAGDHATTREDKIAFRRAYCSAVIRGRHMFSSLQESAALVSCEPPDPFTIAVLRSGLTILMVSFFSAQDRCRKEVLAIHQYIPSHVSAHYLLFPEELNQDYHPLQSLYFCNS